MTTKSKKIIFGIFYFGFFIILGFYAFKFFLFEADYSRNLIPTGCHRYCLLERGKIINTSPLIIGISFTIGLIFTTIAALANRRKLNAPTKFGIITFIIILLIGAFISFLRYYTQVSLFDFIDPNTYH